MRRALVVGATGLVGTEIVQEILTTPYYDKVVVVARQPQPFQHRALQWIQLDDFERLETVLKTVYVDHVYCAMGTTIKTAGSKERFTKIDLEYPFRVARAVRQNQANHFLLVSSMGANPKSKFFYNRIKGELEQKLSELSYPSVTCFRPSVLDGERKEFRLAEKISIPLLKFLNIITLTSLRNYAPIDAKTIAKAMYAWARKEEVGRKIFKSYAIKKFVKHLEATGKANANPQGQACSTKKSDWSDVA